MSAWEKRLNLRLLNIFQRKEAKMPKVARTISYTIALFCLCIMLLVQLDVIAGDRLDVLIFLGYGILFHTIGNGFRS